MKLNVAKASRGAKLSLMFLGGHLREGCCVFRRIIHQHGIYETLFMISADEYILA